MDSYSFYKSLYDRELARRTYLDSAVNIPITILTILGAAVSFIINKAQFVFGNQCFDVSIVLLISTFITLFLGIMFLISSFNNFFWGYGYRNVATPSKIRQLELDIILYNKKVEKDEMMDFKNEIIEKLISITDNHVYFNDKRSLNLYRAKTFIIVSLFFVLIQLALIFI